MILQSFADVRFRAPSLAIKLRSFSYKTRPNRTFQQVNFIKVYESIFGQFRNSCKENSNFEKKLQFDYKFKKNEPNSTTARIHSIRNSRVKVIIHSTAEDLIRLAAASMVSTVVDLTLSLNSIDHVYFIFCYILFIIGPFLENQFIIRFQSYSIDHLIRRICKVKSLIMTTLKIYP